MDKIKEIINGIYDNLELRRTVVPLFIGNPGVAKSTIIREFAEEKGVKLVPFVTSQRNPFEISGLAMPSKETHRMEFWDFDVLLDLKDGDILFFDEIFNGNPTVLNACLTLLEDREMISGHKLPNIMIVAAANPQGMVPLTPQIKERFVWYNVEFKKSFWYDYMQNKYDMPKTILSKLASLIESETFTNTGGNFHTPRSIDKATNLYLNNVSIPWDRTVGIALDTIISNPFGEEVELAEGRVLKVDESIKWSDLYKLSRGVETSKINDSNAVFDIILESISNRKKGVTIKLLQDIFDISEAKSKQKIELSPETPIMSYVSRNEANKIRLKLLDVGAVTRLRLRK